MSELVTLRDNATVTLKNYLFFLSLVTGLSIL